MGREKLPSTSIVITSSSAGQCRNCFRLVHYMKFRVQRWRGVRSLLIASFLTISFILLTSLSTLTPSTSTTAATNANSTAGLTSRLFSYLANLVSPRFVEPPAPPHRLLCWVLTSPANLVPRTQLIKRTWGPRCDITLYMSSGEGNTSFPTIGLGTGEGSKQYNAEKALKAWSYIYEHHRDDADFFYKADDDTYAIIENLRHYLDDKDPKQPEFYGHRFLLSSKKVEYMSGGPGFVLTRRALDMLIRAFKENPECIPPGPGEDWKTGKCLTSVGAKAVDTRDELGRERFMVFQVKSHLLGRYPKWYEKYDVDGQAKGHLCCSYYPISFHYVRDNDILVLEWFFYHAQVFGKEPTFDNTQDFVKLDQIVFKTAANTNNTTEKKATEKPGDVEGFGVVEEIGKGKDKKSQVHKMQSLTKGQATP